MDAFLQTAWSLVGDAKAVNKHYADAAKSREDVGLAIARVETFDSPSTSGAIALEGSGAVVLPLAFAKVMTSSQSAQDINDVLTQCRFWLTADAVPSLRTLLARARTTRADIQKKKKVDHWEVQRWTEVEERAAAGLARLGETTEAETLLPAHPGLLNALLSRGIGEDKAIERMRGLSSGDEESFRDVQGLLPALSKSGNKDVGAAMIGLLHTPIAIHALVALATTKDARAIAPARALLKETRGDAWSVNVHRLAAEHVLRAHGEKFSLELARASVDWPFIDYRTYPPEAVALRAIAVSALALHGDERDKSRARKYARSHHDAVREAALGAFAKRPTLTGWDAGRVVFTKSKGGAKALLAALADETAVFPHEIVHGLAKDKSAYGELARFITTQFEERMSFAYDDDVEMDADFETYIEVAEDLPKKTFSASKNAYVRAKILEDDVESVSLADAEPPVVDRGCVVQRFDSPANFWKGGVSHFVVAADAERALVVGPRSSLFDTRACKLVRDVGDGSDVLAAAIAPKGDTFAWAKKDGVEIHHDAIASAPVTATCLAFSPDGAKLAAGTKKDVSIIDASGKVAATFPTSGLVRGIAWLGPKRIVALVDKGKKSAFLDVDVAKSKAKESATDGAELFAAFGTRMIATSDGKATRVYDSKLKRKMVVPHDERVHEIAIESERALIVRRAVEGESGTVAKRMKIGGKAPVEENIAPYRDVACEHLGVAGNRVYAVSEGELVRCHEDAKASPPANVHTEQVTGIAALPDGRIISTGWEGRLLLWNAAGGEAETLHDQKERIDALACVGTKVYFDHDKAIKAFDVSSKTLSYVLGGEDLDEDLAKHMPSVESVAAGPTRLAWGDDNGFVHIVNLATGEELASAQIDEEDISGMAMDASERIYAGSEKGMLACFESDGTKKWSRVETGVDVLTGELYGNPHREIAFIAAHEPWIALVASDDTMRVFDGPSGERVLRCFRGCGIFNGAAFSPSGELVAYSTGNRFEVVARATGETIASLDTETWKGAGEPTRVAFIDESTAIVGTENGSIYRVKITGKAR